MSQAPKSDPNYIVLYHEDVTGCAESVEYVTADYARQLERENAALREAFAKADVMYEYRRDDGQRQWVTFSMWIHKGQIVVLMDTAALVAARAKEGKP